MVHSKALEINLADYHIDVKMDPKYQVIQEIMERYYGLAEGLNTFLKEISHPYRNWQFIVTEARTYALDYFHIFKSHPKGAEGALLFIEIFLNAITQSNNPEVHPDATDNLLLYLQKIIKDAGPEIPRFLPVVQSAFKKIRELDDKTFFLFVKSYYPLKKHGEFLLKYPEETIGDPGETCLLLHRYFEQTYAYWLSEPDPETLFEKELQEDQPPKDLSHLFNEVSHARLRELATRLNTLCDPNSVDLRDKIGQRLTLPGFNQIAEAYRNIPRRLQEAGASKGLGNKWKLIFLFQIMNLPGLSNAHEEALREINQTVGHLIQHEKGWNLEKLIRQTFALLKDSIEKYPSAALNGVLNMGKGVYKTDDPGLIRYFIDSVIDLEFQTPGISGVGNDWQIQSNNAHLLNIRTWLELIELNPKRSVMLLSNLSIYLALCGVFIKDTDLFSRDITRLLNADIRPVYNLVKQMTRLMPVFFNDIGAEGLLRDISTEIDELSHRKDILIHFLRKQSHVESSNQVIKFIEAVFQFWATQDKECLKPFLPPSIYEQIEAKGIYVDGFHRIMTTLEKEGHAFAENLFLLEDARLEDVLRQVPQASHTDRRRFRLAIDFYRLLIQKYSFNFIEFDRYLSRLNDESLPDINRLKKALTETNLKKKLFGLLDYLELLKGVILSGKTYDAKEDIYKKRHFTVDIPSTYGSYREPKFDALGLSFRLESLVNTLFEEIIHQFDFSLITKATFYQIYDLLLLLEKALKLDGISSLEMERHLDLIYHSLEVKGFTFTQYMDIFKGLSQAVSNVIHDYFNTIYEQSLNRVLVRLPMNQILSKYLAANKDPNFENIKHRVFEIFFRDRIALSAGLQRLDLFISRILSTLFHQANQLPKEKLHQLLLYDPERAMMSINKAKSRILGVIYLGNKGFNLVKLHNFGFPVPPGFIVTTEAFRFREVVNGFPPAAKNLKEQLRLHLRYLQRLAGKTFGDPKNPLLLSVRSGSSISQPGMMDTFLNVGMNEEIAVGVAARTQNPWFAWDNYRRFLQCYGMSFGMDRDDFDAIINSFKRYLEIPFKRNLSGDQMRLVALAYKKMILDIGIKIAEDPFEQLLVTIQRVFDSWDSHKAKAYRRILGISDDWGTTVTIQAMVFGNLSGNSGTGVLFTHNPRWSGETLGLWGDFTTQNQGEDVALGLVRTLPISIRQQDTELRDTDITLETHFPKIYQTLEHRANDLIYKKGWGPQEIEFTFESPSPKDLYFLQARDMVVRERTEAFSFDFSQISEDRYLAHGLGAGGGAMTGRAVFSLEDIDSWRRSEPDTHLILIRSDTVPDDIREIHAADGLLTGRGGVSSHAAVVAYRLGKTCVVGCDALTCYEKEKECRLNQNLIRSGDFISIDGREGSIYKGLIPVMEK
ncbi:MAG: pyruvate, phosphate dikinase [Desulfobacterales bacterium CG07_land_8_20_14_0_80_52_14]|nr:MAG: pyruvate, phosphate dikinase [Desulfobacterales bacterium CG23_combo_of_CG06-09_8_20_14_all_52_9]PIU49607.1 MAG: pyruvate, phosphate dikinase [Desulfobacterales bacterium CG07_land_8_20_14_0_80_52_14]